MKWNKVKPGTYKSACGRWVVQSKDSKWSLHDLSLPRGKRRVLTGAKSKKECQEYALKSSSKPSSPQKKPSKPSPEKKMSLADELRSLRLTLDGLTTKVAQLSHAVNELAKHEDSK